MDFKKIVFYVLIFIAIFALYRWLFGDSKTTYILDMGNAKHSHTKKLKNGAGSNEFGYSFWIFVKGWEYRLASEKIIIRRKNNDKFCPKISLAGNVNDLVITLASLSEDGSEAESCVIKNIPLQKWTHVVVTTNTQSIDTYIDGKLVKTCILPGAPSISEESEVEICPGESDASTQKGFNGNISKVRYYARTLNPREVYELYKEGPYRGLFKNFLNKYKLRFAYYVDGEEAGGITI